MCPRRSGCVVMWYYLSVCMCMCMCLCRKKNSERKNLGDKAEISGTGREFFGLQREIFGLLGLDVIGMALVCVLVEVHC